MNITKFGHSYLCLQEGETTILIDPGNLVESVDTPAPISAILLTHIHPDHTDPTKIADLLTKNADCTVFAHESVLAHLRDNHIDESRLHSVTTGDAVEIGSMRVTFTGGQHAMIHPDIDRIDNLGIMIDDGQFFYPGDALEIPEKPVVVLALPASAPWMKISETLDYLAAVRPKRTFPVHDAILSESGKNIVDTMLRNKSTALGVLYERIDGVSSIEI